MSCTKKATEEQSTLLPYAKQCKNRVVYNKIYTK